MEVSMKEGGGAQPHYNHLTKDVLSFDRIDGFSNFNALCLIHDLDINEPLSEDYYTKYTVKKQNGKVRILHEPKPVLKEVQEQLLHFIYSLDERIVKNSFLKKNVNKYKLQECAVAYRPGVSVIRNANFHVDNDLVMKVDIKDFFGNVKTEKLIAFWANLLNLRMNYLIEIGILDEKISNDDRLIVITRLCKKLTYVTSLDGFLPQGSPTSGMLANYYLVQFDKFFLAYCIRNGLNYSRYSDDITVSGAKDKLRPQSVLGTINRLLKREQLHLNKTKTRVLRKNQRQIVTGVVVNVKKSVPKSLKRDLRQQMYYLKKFGETHIAHKKTAAYKYLLVLKGEISWVLAVEKENAEFRRYFGELTILLRFCEANRNLEEALQYIHSVEQLAEKLKATESPVFGNVEWKKEDESFAPRPEGFSKGHISIHKRGKDRSMFTEKAVAEHFAQLNDGWRLPTTEDFQVYLEETRYEDRQLLGLRIPMDPQFNGIFNQTKKATAFNKIAAYWTSNIAHLPNMSQSNRRIGRDVFIVLPRKSTFTSKLNHKFNRCSQSAGYVTVNEFLPLVGPTLDNKSNFSDTIFDYEPRKKDYPAAFSLRLVRSVASEQRVTLNEFSPEFWSSVSRSKYSVDMSNLAMEKIPLPSLMEWQSSSILLGNNQLKYIELNGIAPVNRIDLSHNVLENFDLLALPESVKHVLLHGNSNLSDKPVPIEALLPRLHELTIDTPSIPTPVFAQMYETVLELEWHHVSTDDEIDQLIHQNSSVQALHVTVQIGANKIESARLFERLNGISGVETLSILFEPHHDELKLKLNALKNAEVFELGQVLELSEFGDPGDLFSKEHVFYPSQLLSNGIQTVILDFSWLPNLIFRDNFGVRPEKYHLLHPGKPSSFLPSTAESHHQPNILVKIIGEKLVRKSESVEDAQYQNLKVFYPLNATLFCEETNSLFDLLPSQQFHVENLVLVCTQRNERLVQRGKVISLFPRSRGIIEVVGLHQNYNNRKSLGFGKSRTFFNFPLLIFSLNYDVYKLSIPFRTMFRRVKDDNFMFTKDLDTNRLNRITLGNKVFSVFKSSKYNDLLVTRQLYHLSVFPVLSPAPAEQTWQNTAKESKQFKVKAKHFSKDLSLETLNREELLVGLKNGSIDAVRLSNKYKKDAELMLAAIQGNPFSFILAHAHLKLNVDFVLKSLKRSWRILVFLNQSMQDELKRKNPVLPAVMDYLFATLNADEVYFMLNLLYRKIAYVTKGPYRFLNEETEDTKGSVIESFGKEIISLHDENRSGMRKMYFNYFIRGGVERQIFNANGFYISLKAVKLNPLDCVSLDLSYSKEKIALILPEMPNLKVLKISFTRYVDVSNLPVLPNCEDLYMDGVDIFSLGDFAAFCEKFPSLKRLYIRSLPLLFPEQIRFIIEHSPYLEYLDMRMEKGEYMALCSEIEQFVMDSGRTIVLPEMD